jgi:hypothetical protein
MLTLQYKVTDEVLAMRVSRLFRLPIVAVGEWLMVLPATVFLGAAALRVLQPRQYEPARTSWIIFEWTTMHISRLGAGTLFIGLPGLVAIVGCATLLRTWREDSALRHDTAETLAIFRRQRTIILAMAAMLLAAVILVFAVSHVVTD